MQLNIPARDSTTGRAWNNLSVTQKAVLFLAVVYVLFVGPIVLDLNENAVGDTVAGLRLSLLTQEGISVKEPQFRVELFNTGQDDLLLDLRMIVGKQYPDAITLTLTNAKGQSWELQSIGPPGIAGRVDPMIVPLPLGAAYTILVDLRQYWSLDWKEFTIELSQGSYSLQAHYTAKRVFEKMANFHGECSGMGPYWTGTVSSKVLQFDVST